jgi:hypothetical protein
MTIKGLSVFICNARDQTQGLGYGKQAGAVPLSYIPNPQLRLVSW